MTRIDMIDDDLNAEAIYAALTYLRDYAESDEGEAAIRELFDRRSAKVDFGSSRLLILRDSGQKRLRGHPRSNRQTPQRAPPVPRSRFRAHNISRPSARHIRTRTPDQKSATSAIAGRYE